MYLLGRSIASSRAGHAEILRAALVGLMAGCKGLWEAERLTASLSVDHETTVARSLRLLRAERASSIQSGRS